MWSDLAKVTQNVSSGCKSHLASSLYYTAYLTFTWHSGPEQYSSKLPLQSSKMFTSFVLYIYSQPSMSMGSKSTDSANCGSFSTAVFAIEKSTNKWTYVVQSCVVWVSCSCSQVSYNPLYFFDISCNVSSFIYNFIDFGPFLPLDCPVKGWPILFIFSKSPPLFFF